MKSVKTFLRAIIPLALRRERDIALRLGPGAGGIYLRLRALKIIGMRPLENKLVPSNVRSFLFVCFGNIMRSPMADALLKVAAQEAGGEVRSDSAGLHAIADNPAHPWAKVAAEDLGISLAGHRAKLLTLEMMERADAIFAMDFQNVAELLHLYPQCEPKIFLLGAYSTGTPRRAEIPDPYFGDVEGTRQCYRVLQTCIRSLLASRSASTD